MDEQKPTDQDATIGLPAGPTATPEPAPAASPAPDGPTAQAPTATPTAEAADTAPLLVPPPAPAVAPNPAAVPYAAIVPGAATLPGPTAVPAPRRPLVLIGALALVAGWAIAMTAVFAIDRNAHNDEVKTLNAQAAERDRQLAQLKSQRTAIEAKLADAEKRALTPAQHATMKGCVTELRDLERLIASIPKTALPRLPRGSSATTFILPSGNQCGAMAKSMPK